MLALNLNLDSIYCTNNYSLDVLYSTLFLHHMHILVSLNLRDQAYDKHGWRCKNAINISEQLQNYSLTHWALKNLNENLDL